MGKRSDFARRPMDDYPTIDPRAVPPLIPHLEGVQTFAEPCAGDGDLVRQLESFGLVCTLSGDLKNDGFDALAMTDVGAADAIITNPPWSRPILHAMIERFQSLAQTWLLFDAGWAFTKQAHRYLGHCSHIVTIGRLKWIPNSPFSGKDDCAWYRFDAAHTGGPRFYGFDPDASKRTPVYA